MTDWKTHRLKFFIGAVLALTSVCIYLPVRQHAFINFDDDVYVTLNPLVTGGFSWQAAGKALTACYGCNWHPVTTFSHMLDCQLFGLNAGKHHLTNVLIHAVNAVLLFLLLNRLTGAAWRSGVVAALFAWHPLHVESVAWIAERKDLLSTFFAFLALLAYSRYAEERSLKKSAFLPYLAALILFALGLMSKPMLVTLPFVMLLLDYWPLRRVALAAKFSLKGAMPLIIEKVPFFGLSLVSCGITFWVQRQSGAVESVENLPLSARVANMFVAYARYIELLFYPRDLAVLYPNPGHWPMWRVAGSAVCLVGLSWFFARKVVRRPYLLTGWLWFLGMLLPVIGLVQVGEQSMADRYTYLPYVGLFVALVWGVSDGAVRWQIPRAVLAVVTALFLAGCAAGTMQQLPYWKNSETLFTRTLAVTENNPSAHLNLGCALFDRGAYAEAETQFTATLSLRPNLMRGLFDLGRAQERLLKYDLAVSSYQAALAITPEDPEVNFGLANTLVALGRSQEAVPYYQAAVRAKPNYAELECNYGAALDRVGRWEEGRTHLLEAVRLKPAMGVAHRLLADQLARAGKIEDAIATYRQVLQIDPGDVQARTSLGVGLELRGRMAEAETEYRAALQADPNSAPANSAYGIFLARQGKSADAEEHFRRVTEMDPKNADAHYNLGNTLMAQSKYAAAAIQYSEVLRLNPADANARRKLAECEAHR